MVKLLDSEIKSLTVIGIAPQTFQLLNTIKKNRPDIKITCIDETHKSIGLHSLGNKLLRKLINDYSKMGIKFILKPIIKNGYLN